MFQFSVNSFTHGDTRSNLHFEYACYLMCNAFEIDCVLMQNLELEIGIFEYAQLRGKLTPLAVNLFLKKKKSLAQKSVIQNDGSLRKESLSWNLNPAYDVLKECTEKKSSRVSRVRRLHSKAAAFIATKIRERLFISWRDHNFCHGRKGLDARFYINGAVRTALTSRSRWPGELAATIFTSWSRWVRDRRSKRHPGRGLTR